MKKYLDWEEHLKKVNKKINPTIYKIKTQHPLNLNPIVISELFSQQLRNLPIKEVIS